jgi:type IV secretory pathway VirB2 component (pilin)
MPDNDPLRPNPDPLRPPEPQPYQSPDWNPAQRPPFEPPGTPSPVDPTRNPWQSPGMVGFSRFVTFLLAFSLVGIIASTAYAAATFAGGGAMPWSTPLQNLRADITGPTAAILAAIGFVFVMGILIFGGELNHFGRSICFLILTASVLVGGSNLLTGIGIAGATIDGAAWFDVGSFGFDATTGLVSGTITVGLYWAARGGCGLPFPRLGSASVTK